MGFVLRLIIVTKESLVETKLQNDRHESQRRGQQRKHAKLARSQVFPIDRDQHQPERAVDQAADAKDQRVLDGLFDLVVNRSLLPPRLVFSLAERKHEEKESERRGGEAHVRGSPQCRRREDE